MAPEHFAKVSESLNKLVNKEEEDVEKEKEETQQFYKRCDMWSFGIVIYEILTLTRPVRFHLVIFFTMLHHFHAFNMLSSYVVL